MQQALWYFHAGGILMWPLAACALLVVVVVVERLIRLRRPALIDASATDDVRKLVEQGYPRQAADKYRDSPVLISRVVSRAIDNHLKYGIDIDTALVQSAERGLRPLLNNVGILVLIARVAPLLGLLGAVVGLINGFEALEKSGAGKEQFAAAVRVALVTTAAGLIVAIPALVAAASCRGRVRRIQAEFEEILHAVAGSVRAGPARPPEKAAPPMTEDGEVVLPSILTGEQKP